MESAPIRAATTDERSPAPTDVLVIGAGIIGLACAVELAQRGAAVTVVDRGEVGRGASYGNAGWLTPSLAAPLAQPGAASKAIRWMLDPESPFHIKPSLDPALARWLWTFWRASTPERFERGVRALVELCRWSVDAWEREAAAPGEDFGFNRRGLVMPLESDTSAEIAKRHAALTERCGVAWEWWDADRVREHEPIVKGPIVGGLYFPYEAHCEPNLAVRRLRTRTESLGVRIVEHAEVSGFETRSGVVRAARVGAGALRAKEFVIASGAWAGAMGASLGLRIPMRSGKGYSVLLPRGERHPSRPIYLADRKIAVTPHANTLRLAGTLEVVGLDASINMRRVNAIVRGAATMLDIEPPRVRVEPAQAELEQSRTDEEPTRALVRPWVGLRPCLANGMPAIGRAPGFENVWLAIGHQMTGLKCAPASALLLAELMAGTKPTFDTTPFDPAQCCAATRRR